MTIKKITTTARSR